MGPTDLAHTRHAWSGPVRESEPVVVHRVHELHGAIERGLAELARVVLSVGPEVDAAGGDMCVGAVPGAQQRERGVVVLRVAPPFAWRSRRRPDRGCSAGCGSLGSSRADRRRDGGRGRGRYRTRPELRGSGCRGHLERQGTRTSFSSSTPSSNRFTSLRTRRADFSSHRPRDARHSPPRRACGE